MMHGDVISSGQTAPDGVGCGMITALQARDIAGPSVAERVDALAPLIEAAAREKKRHICLHDDFWTNGGYGPTKEWNEAKEMLEKLGYYVEFFYEERQFVDMYTIIRW